MGGKMKSGITYFTYQITLTDQTGKTEEFAILLPEKESGLFGHDFKKSVDILTSMFNLVGIVTVSFKRINIGGY